MSVIPLTIDGPDRTVVQDKADFDFEGKVALILGLDAAQLTRGSASNVSYDLRIGCQCRDHREQDVKQIPQDGQITLSPGTAIIIQTEESLYLPRRMYGIIAPRVSLLQRGLSSTFSKVDPGYPGPLLITVFNLGQTTVTLHRGERFCALTLFEVAAGAKLYEKGAQQITAPSIMPPRRTLREWIESHVEAHHIMAIVVLIVATLLLAAVEIALILTIRRRS